MYAPDTQRNGIALPFWDVPWGHVDDVSSLSALYQSVMGLRCLAHRGF